jgi:nitrate reductase NapE component
MRCTRIPDGVVTCSGSSVDMGADLTGAGAGGLLEPELATFLLVVVVGFPLLVVGVAAGFGVRAGTVVFGAGLG